MDRTDAHVRRVVARWLRSYRSRIRTLGTSMAGWDRGYIMGFLNGANAAHATWKQVRRILDGS